MKRQLKKGDGLATVVIGIVFIVLVLLIVPAFKNLQASGTNQTGAIAKTNVAITNQALTDAAAVASYGYTGTTGITASQADTNGGNNQGGGK